MFPTSDDDLIREFLAQYDSQATIDAYARDIHSLRLAIAPMSLLDAKLADLRRWQSELEASGKKASTITRKLAAISAFYRCVWEDERIPINPAARLRPPKRQGGSKVTRFCSPEQVEAIIAAARPGRDQLLIKTLYTTACRVSEICAVTYEDLLPGRKIRVLGKGDKIRAVDCSEQIFDELCSLARTVGPGKRLFRLDRKRAWEIVHNAAEKAGLEGISPHWLRHSHASTALARGCPLASVAAQLGHATPETTTRFYVHRDPETSSSADFLDLD